LLSDIFILVCFHSWKGGRELCFSRQDRFRIKVVIFVEDYMKRIGSVNLMKNTSYFDLLVSKYGFLRPNFQSYLQVSPCSKELIPRVLVPKKDAVLVADLIDSIDLFLREEISPESIH